MVRGVFQMEKNTPGGRELKFQIGVIAETEGGERKHECHEYSM